MEEGVRKRPGLGAGSRKGGILSTPKGTAHHNHNQPYGSLHSLSTPHHL